MLTRRELIKLGLAASVLPRSAYAARAANWRFGVFSDTHFGVAGNEDKNRALLMELAALAPDFAINAGDLTERAWPEEFDAALRTFQRAPYPVHSTPGNHDARWAPRGMTMFRERVGEPHRLFTHKGCAFLLLNSTVPLSHWGHIGGPQQRWIDEQLRTIRQDTPLFVFMHHSVGRGGGVDDEARLFEVLVNYNVKVMFTAHGHSDLLWDWNGITATMGKGLYQGTYQVAEVDESAGELRISRRTTEHAPELFATVPLASTRKKTVVRGVSLEGEASGVVRLAWQRPLGGGVLSQLQLRDGTLYVSAMDGALYAFSARDGRQQWKAETGDYCFSSPTVAKDVVIVGSADGNAYCFDRRNGKLRWRAQTNGPVYGSAAIAGDIAAIASGDGSIYGIDLKRGDVRWRHALDAGPSAFVQSPAATDGRNIYFGAWDQNVYALDAQTGAEVWRYRATERGFYFSAAIARPALANGVLYIPANENALHAIDTATGKAVWKQKAPGDKFGYSSPVLVGDRIYIGSLGDKGEVHCLDANTGDFIWTSATGAQIYESSPAVSDDFLAIGSVNGTLNVLRNTDGAIIGAYRFPPGLFTSSPVVQGKRVYAATMAEVVAAFEIGQVASETTGSR